jgi:serpin B
MGRLRAIGLLLLLVLSGCIGSEPREAASSAKSRRLASSAVVSEAKTLVADNTEFAVALYRQLSQENKNLVFSPYDLSLLLAMLYGGASGETQQEIGKVLQLTFPTNKLPTAFNALDLTLTRQNGRVPETDCCLKLATALWGQRGYTFRPEFLDLLAKYYGSEVNLVDFANAPEAARRLINTWANRETEGEIVNLLPEGTIINLTEFVPVDAAYLKAKWLQPFDPRKTDPAEFSLLEGDKVLTPTMSQFGTFKYGEQENCQAVELPFATGKLACLILLPKEGAFEQFEQELSGACLAEIDQALWPTQLDLAVPKFALTSGCMLKSALANMGMPSAFDPKANFSAMAVDNQLFIYDVYHKASIEVNEAGTEAAAAAPVISDRELKGPGIEMKINRPFIFLIRDLDTKSVIFLGRVLDPRA